MSSFNSQKAVILNQQEGRKLWIWGDLYTLKITGEETNGTYALVETSKRSTICKASAGLPSAKLQDPLDIAHARCRNPSGRQHSNPAS